MPEVPLEHAQETIEHHAHESTEKWIMGVALTAAVLAALAAITALLAEHHANEAMITQIQASDKWNQYQADSIKAKVIEAKLGLSTTLGKQANAGDTERIAKYDKEMPEIKREAQEKEQESEHHLRQHKPLSRGVTMFQLAIAIGAIAVLTHRKEFWLVAVGFGGVGLWFLFSGLGS
jgi:hypothetical protein